MAKKKCPHCERQAGRMHCECEGRQPCEACRRKHEACDNLADMIVSYLENGWSVSALCGNDSFDTLTLADALDTFGYTEQATLVRNEALASMAARKDGKLLPLANLTNIALEYDMPDGLLEEEPLTGNLHIRRVDQQ